MAVGGIPPRDDPDEAWGGGETRTLPPGEDSTGGRRARAVPALVGGMPAGEDNVTGEGPSRGPYNETHTTQAAMNTLERRGRPGDYLKIVTEGEDHAVVDANQANRRA